MQHKYFLTGQQENIKKEITEADNCNNFFYLTGEPGTGKTLLLYDLAREFSKKGKTLIIHCGIFAPKQNDIKIEQLKIIEAKELKYHFSLAEYKYILIDETQRIYKDQFDDICKSVNENNQVCIFSADPQQTLSRKEEGRNIVEEIKNIVPKKAIYRLTNKIRTNEELYSFIQCLMNLNQAECLPDYSGVQVEYANSPYEALDMIKYYREKGYVFINYPISQTDPLNQFFKQIGKDKIYKVDEVHQVIGQEFDNIVIFMDNYFSYKEGKLCADPTLDQNYLYDQLVYQAVTRAREKLTIIVVKNMELFRNIVSVLNPTKNKTQ